MRSITSSRLSARLPAAMGQCRWAGAAAPARAVRPAPWRPQTFALTQWVARSDDRPDEHGTPRLGSTPNSGEDAVHVGGLGLEQDAPGREVAALAEAARPVRVGSRQVEGLVEVALVVQQCDQTAESVRGGA